MKGKKSDIKVHTRTSPFGRLPNGEWGNVKVTYVTHNAWIVEESGDLYLPKTANVFVPTQVTKCVIEKDGDFYRANLAACSNRQTMISVKEKIARKKSILDMIEPWKPVYYKKFSRIV